MSTPTVEHLSPQERATRGRAARATSPRSGHGNWEPAVTRTSPVDVLRQQAASRVPDLVPLRHSRMAASPFAFYRGAAAVMAMDLAGTPESGLRVQCCGDAHLANFGGYAAPDRTMVFDINDFDETLPGPWEWDLKRLVASFEIAARSRDFDDKLRRRVVVSAARSYRNAMREFAAMRNLDLWYQRIDEYDVASTWKQRVPTAAMKRYERNLAKARSKDSMRAFDKLTTTVDGEVRIISDPPLVVRLEDLSSAAEADKIRERLHAWFRDYRQSLQPDRRALLQSFELVDVARKVVGVGSVGTRCWIAYLRGRDGADPLFLQIKEAQASVLAPYRTASAYRHHGRRVVEGQRMMQATSDIFLGWERGNDLDGNPHDFYVRQLWDGKLSPAIDIMEPEVFELFGELCASTLARAHARSGDRIAIAAYLGTGAILDEAMARFAAAYADQNERDHAAVVAAIASGELPAAPDPTAG